MTTGGEGGMLTTDDRALWSAMWSYKDHGKSWDAVYEREHAAGFRWLHESFGINARMLEMQAAVGRVQLRHLEDWVCERNDNAEAILRSIEPFAGPDGPVRAPVLREDTGGNASSRHSYYRLYAYARPENLAPGWNRDRIIAAINDAGVPCYQGSCPEVYLEKAFEGTGWRPAEPLAVARELGETSLMFLVHPTLTAAEIEASTRGITAVLRRASAH